MSKTPAETHPDYAIEGSWADFDRLPGWKIKEGPVPYSGQYGAALWNGEEGEACELEGLRGGDLAEVALKIDEWLAGR